MIAMRRLCISIMLTVLLAVVMEPGVKGEETSAMDRMISCQLQVKQQPDYLSCVGAKLRSFVKVQITFNLPHEGLSIPYEDLWYSSGQAVGCRRFLKFPVPPGKVFNLIVNCRDKEVDQAYIIACEDTITRLLLDAALNGDAINLVSVATDHFDELISSFSRSNFHPYDGTRRKLSNLVDLVIESDDHRKHSILGYFNE